MQETQTKPVLNPEPEFPYLTIAWKPEAIIQIQMTGAEFQNLQILSNLLGSVVDKTIQDNLSTGVFKGVKQEDLIQEEGQNPKLREDFWSKIEENSTN